MLYLSYDMFYCYLTIACMFCQRPVSYNTYLILMQLYENNFLCLYFRHSTLGRSLSRERSSPSESQSSSTPWRRSVSRDLASDIESVFKDNSATQRPRGKIF